MVDQKVNEIFRELVGSKANRLRGDHYPADVNSLITAALAEENPDWTEEDLVEKDKIGLNLVCWQSDAAFLVALILFPERFTYEEIQEGLLGFFLHAPDHVVAAARLAGYELSEE